MIKTFWLTFFLDTVYINIKWTKISRKHILALVKIMQKSFFLGGYFLTHQVVVDW